LESDEKLDTGQATQHSEETEIPAPEMLVIWKCESLATAFVRQALLPVVGVPKAVLVGFAGIVGGGVPAGSVMLYCLRTCVGFFPYCVRRDGLFQAAFTSLAKFR
jgi:hypothetical protein